GGLRASEQTSILEAPACLHRTSAGRRPPVSAIRCLTFWCSSPHRTSGSSASQSLHCYRVNTIGIQAAKPAVRATLLSTFRARHVLRRCRAAVHFFAGLVGVLFQFQR